MSHPIKQLIPFMAMFVAILMAMISITVVSSCATIPSKSAIIKPITNKKPSVLSFVKELQYSYPTAVSIYYTGLFGRLRIAGAGVVLACKKNEHRVVLSAFHVVKEFIGNSIAAIQVGHNSTNLVPVRIGKYSIGSDLVLLHGILPEKQDCMEASLASIEPSIGSTFWVIGSPMGQERNVTRGIFSYRFKKHNAYIYRSDVDIFYGNSGGGVFNDQGQLVGIVSFNQLVQQKDSAQNTILHFISGGGCAIGWITLKVFIKGAF